MTVRGLLGQALVEALHALPDDAARASWEAQSVSQLSPGPVVDDEKLVRTLDQPVHFEEDGVTVKAAAFMGMGSIGLSVVRGAHCTRDGMVEHAFARLRAFDSPGATAVPNFAKRRPKALVSFTAVELRGVRSDQTGARVMGVYDTALSGSSADQAHADVVAFNAAAAERKARRWMQREAQSRMDWIDCACTSAAPAGQSLLEAQKDGPA